MTQPFVYYLNNTNSSFWSFSTGDKTFSILTTPLIPPPPTVAAVGDRTFTIIGVQ